MDVFARQPVRRGDQQHLEFGRGRRVTQGVETGAIEARAAVALVEVDVLSLEGKAFLLHIPLEPLQLLIDLLVPRLARGRNPSVDRRTHHSPPPLNSPPVPEPPTGAGVDMPGPSDERRRCGWPSYDEPSSLVSPLPPRPTSLRGGYPRRGGLRFSRLWRVKQNLSFVISPSRLSSRAGSPSAVAARGSRS